MLRATMFRINVLFSIALCFSLVTPIAAHSSGMSAKEMNDFFTRAKLSAHCNYITTEETKYILDAMRNGAVRWFGGDLARNIDKASSERARFIIDTMKDAELSCGAISDRLMGTVQAIKEKYSKEHNRN